MLALCLLLAAEVPGGFATASNQSLFFDHPVVRRGFHFQVAFGFGGGPCGISAPLLSPGADLRVGAK
jgi:hypothetical protein